MTPNLLVATQKAFSPHKWFKSTKSERPTRTIEEWTVPVPGRYEYIPGRGWYLIATLKDATAHTSELKSADGGSVLLAKSPQTKEYVKLDLPVQVHKSKVLPGRWFLDSEYKLRKKRGVIKNELGKSVEVGFFRLDDGTWVHCWDAEGNFIPGDPKIRGYKRWCIDAQTKQFRPMLKRDDPSYVSSRGNSIERDGDSHSQDSMSTAYRSSRPGSMRNGPSVAGSKASSIRFGPSTPASQPPSQRPSRQSSPVRNNSIPLEEAKATLRHMAKQQEEAASAIAAARAARTYSKNRVDQIERGRATVSVGN